MVRDQQVGVWEQNMVVRAGLNNKNAKGREEAVAKAQEKLTLEGHRGTKTGDLVTILV
jgi:hypothetical protein